MASALLDFIHKAPLKQDLWAGPEAEAGAQEPEAQL